MTGLVVGSTDSLISSATEAWYKHLRRFRQRIRARINADIVVCEAPTRRVLASLLDTKAMKTLDSIKNAVTHAFAGSLAAYL